MDVQKKILQRFKCALWLFAGVFLVLQLDACSSTCAKDEDCQRGFHCQITSQRCIQQCKASKECAPEESCDSQLGKCIGKKCLPKAQQICSNEKLYWVDSCGVQGDYIERCGQLTCPNGACEPGEDCSSCPADCKCPSGQLCDSAVGYCKDNKTNPCGNGVCEPQQSEDCANCPKDCACLSLLGQSCVQGKCIAQCEEGKPCGNGGICKGGKCNQSGGCNSSSDCKQGELCIHQKCQPCRSHTDCGQGKQCQSGQCLISVVLYHQGYRWSDLSIPSSCKDYLRPKAGYAPATKSGVYWLKPNNTSVFLTYCEMQESGGGWSLALKIDGRKSTFRYDSSLWTNRSTYNSQSYKLDNTESKLASFHTLPFTDILLGMKDLKTGSLRFLKVGYPASSLQALFSRSKFTSFKQKAGRKAWKKLLSNASTQANCNAEGVNYKTPYPNKSSCVGKLRFGLITNNETECDTPDAFIGIGSHMYHQKVATAGNYVGYKENDNGLRNTPVIAYLFVR